MVLGSLVLWSDGMVLPALETKLPAEFTIMSSRFGPPVWLGSRFHNMADTIPVVLKEVVEGWVSKGLFFSWLPILRLDWFCVGLQFLGWEFRFFLE